MNNGRLARFFLRHRFDHIQRASDMCAFLHPSRDVNDNNVGKDFIPLEKWEFSTLNGHHQHKFSEIQKENTIYIHEYQRTQVIELLVMTV
jgi:hypothetical protein